MYRWKLGSVFRKGLLGSGKQWFSRFPFLLQRSNAFPIQSPQEHDQPCLTGKHAAYTRKSFQTGGHPRQRWSRGHALVNNLLKRQSKVVCCRENDSILRCSTITRTEPWFHPAANHQNSSPGPTILLPERPDRSRTSPASTLFPDKPGCFFFGFHRSFRFPQQALCFCDELPVPCLESPVV